MIQSLVRLRAVLAALVLAACATQQPVAPPAETPAPAPQAATDPYLWLEDVDGARAMDWVRAENARSLPVLENDRRYAGLFQSAMTIAQSRDRLPLGNVRDGFVYNFWQDETHVRGIWRRAPIASYASGRPRWETLLDVDALAASEHANWVWKDSDCAPSGDHCMVSLSNGGLDASTWREYDIRAKAFVADGFVVPEAKSRIGWFDNNTLLIATDWGPGTMTPSGYPFVLKSWRRGTPLASAHELMRGQQSDVNVSLSTLDDINGDHIAIANQTVTFFETIYHLVGANGVQRLTLPLKVNIRALHKGKLILTIEQAWQVGGQSYPAGALIAIEMATATQASPRIEVLYAPGPRESIEEVADTHDALLVAGFDNVRGRLRRIAFNGHAWSTTQIALPQTGVVSLHGAAASDSAAFVTYEDFLTPTTLYALDRRATRARSIRALPAQFDASPYVTEQFEATSRDGTRVPYFVVHRRDMALNGENPTLLYAYGGFQLSTTPTYSGVTGKLWLEQGGVYVSANIRGGGEFGPGWHEAGLKTHRQLIYDDFYAVEADLVARHITSPRRLGISGRSNGGLLMGVMLNQHPEMVHAAIVGSPLLDMLRYDQLLAGASWVAEYGSPSVPEERAWLEQMSPYQNLQRREHYPLVFIYTSTKDDRVHPGHARKYAAKLEELGMPFLYYENTDGGHAATANLREVARRRALEFTYLSQQLID